MKKSIIFKNIIILILLTFVSIINAQTKMSKLEINNITLQNNPSKLSTQLKRSGFSKKNVVSAEKFIGSDSLGQFEIYLIEESFSKTNDISDGVSAFYYQAKRKGKVIASTELAFDSENNYAIGEKEIQIRKSAPQSTQKVGDFTTCFPSLLSTAMDCKNFASSLANCIRNCPKNKKNRPKFSCILLCVIQKSPSGFSCVKDAVKLTTCIIEQCAN
jgi:hypothetical protein